MKKRLGLKMTIREIVLAMAEDNPGAVKVCFEIVTHGSRIDPDGGPIGAIMPLLTMDDASIYGADIYTLYEIVCHGEIANIFALFRAVQLGGLEGVRTQSIRDSIKHHTSFDFEKITTAIRVELPNFNTSTIPGN